MPLIHVEQGKTIKERNSNMGLAASQVRLLQLTRRGNDVRCTLTQLSMQKMSLSNDMQKVTRQYQEALSAKTLKWSNNGGVDCIDLTYANLMQPRDAINNNKLNMITDMNGRVVVDSKYKKYAEIISPDGSPGDWESHSSEILAQIVGMDASDIDGADDYWKTYLENKEALEKIEARKPDMSKFTKNKTADLLENLGSFGGIDDWKKAYGNDSKTISGSNISSVINQIKNDLKGYFLDDEDKFETACEVIEDLNKDIEDSITVKDLIDLIVGAYEGPKHIDNQGNENFIWYDTSDPDYAKYKDDYDAWVTERDNAEKLMEDSLAAYNQMFTADTKSKINFYDNLFSAIAEKGWRCYENVADSNYLNQMLQNGMFMITNVQRDAVQNGSDITYKNTYDTDIALNCKNIVQVSDTEYRDDALVKYENEKNLIKCKENKIDARMKNLETEQSSIKQMSESIKKIMDNNIEQHMNIFG